MKKLLLKLAYWILEHYEVRLLPWQSSMMPIPRSVANLLPSARILITANELKNKAQSGEWKRHQSLAGLMKKYPQASQRDIALAIELAVREL